MYPVFIYSKHILLVKDGQANTKESFQTSAFGYYRRLLRPQHSPVIAFDHEILLLLVDEGQKCKDMFKIAIYAVIVYVNNEVTG